MATAGTQGLYCMVELNYNGVFLRTPFSYVDGFVNLFTDIDFSGLTYGECITFLEKFMRQSIRKLYYCEPEKPLVSGIRHIADDVDYSGFIFDAYGTDGKICMYVDHGDQDIESWFDSDTEEEEHDSCVEGDGEGDDGHEEVERKDGSGVDGGVGDEAKGRTNDDDFLSKLCRGDENEVDDGDYEEGNDGDKGMQIHSIFNESTQWKKQRPILGMRFKDPAQLKSMLCNYAVAHGYQLCFEKNDRKRLLVKCCKGKCSFRLWGSWMGEEESFQIKSLADDHNCARNFRLGSLVTYSWIGSHYTKQILQTQKMSVRKLRLEVMKKFGIHVSLGQCRRARIYAMKLIEGTQVEHYAKLWSYAEEIRRTNPGSTVKLDVNSMPDGKTYFNRFYVCFDGIKKGWMEGCRKIIGLDGCFLKGIYKGQLLCAIGRDADNQIYPIAWAIVCVENKENWKWFLDLLIDDLNLNLGNGYSLMSDQHKGLIEAVKEMLPFIEHRQCARHICQNLQKRYSGAHYETLFWRASKSSTEQGFKAVMKEIESTNVNAHKYLMDRDPKTWSLAYFQPGRCCDSVENGMCESFNAVIVDARKKPILTMLEELRLYMMDRLYKMRLKGQKWGNRVCPDIKDKLDLLKEEQRHWEVLPSGLNQFEVRSNVEAFQVDLENKTCSCRIWQLNGYGCVHSVAAISFMNRDVEKYVDPIFSTISYMKSYKFRICSMNGSAMWPETNYLPPLPPINRRLPGRPKTKRRRDASESQGRRTVSKAGKKMRCSTCKVVGHNKATCPIGNPPPKKKAKKGDKNKQAKNASAGEGTSQIGVDRFGNVENGLNLNESSQVCDGQTQEGEEDVLHLDPNTPEDNMHVDGVGAHEVDVSLEEDTQPTITQETLEAEHIQQRPTITSVLHKIRHRKSERILKAKLGKTIGTSTDPGNSKDRPLTLK